MLATRESTLYGLAAEFDNPEDIVIAAHKAYDEGYRRMDAYTPFPVHGLVEAIGFRDNKVPWIIFWGGLIGALGGYALQYWVSAVEYPLNVGGRPLNAWVNFIPVTFECTILLAALTAVFGTLALNGLPKPYHPIFNAEGFERASQDRFFLCVEAADPAFDREGTAEFLRGIGAVRVVEVQR